VATTLTGESVEELFHRAAQLVSAHGYKVSPRGQATREILDVRMRLTRPRARLVHLPPARVLNPAFAVAETVWILSGTDESWIYNYNERLRQYADDGVLRGAYGPRMRRWGGRVDQLHRVVEILKQDPDSRRAVIQLYDPARDAGGHRDVPCTLSYRFHVRHGRLHMSTSMRGQDVWIGLPYDLFATTVLHELMASWLGVDIGEYHHHVDSLHIYERDLDHVRTLPPASFPADMTALATPWNGFDELLSNVVDGAPTGHQGWDAMAATMLSYRQWKNGDDAEALRTAAAVDGPLGEALDTWYERLSARRAETTAGSR
jgi:thymidylate synthase